MFGSRTGSGAGGEGGLLWDADASADGTCWSAATDAEEAAGGGIGIGPAESLAIFSSGSSCSCVEGDGDGRAGDAPRCGPGERDRSFARKENSDT